MAWLEVHEGLPDHPKTRKLARRLEITIPSAVGHLVSLWLWALTYAEDGDLSRHDPEDVAIGAHWEGDPDEFIKALVAVRFVDEDDGHMVIHDWDDYGGKLLEKRRADRERKAAWRKTGHGRNKDATKTRRGRPRDGAGRQPTVPTPPTPPTMEEVERVRVALQEAGYTDDELKGPLVELGLEMSANPDRIKSPVGWARKKAEAVRSARRSEVVRDCENCGGHGMVLVEGDGNEAVPCPVCQSEQGAVAS